MQQIPPHQELNASGISKPARDLILTYQHWWPQSWDCICEGRPYNNLTNEDGWPVVCPVHEWEFQRDRAQAELVASGLSMEIPPAKWVVQKDYDQLDRKFKAVVFQNPLLAEPRVFKDKLDHKTAARWLVDRRHIVALVHHTRAVTISFQHRDVEVDELVMYSPTIVYWMDGDRRNHGRIQELLYYRQYGFAFLIGGE